jgi:hypothetical protein
MQPGMWMQRSLSLSWSEQSCRKEKRIKEEKDGVSPGRKIG